ncbi:polysaccharide pyruvyl transferase family protein [Calycomorphotria hydatis]|uniref:Polysaccharide pyruvyl transferase n=1 Tax=Calycomorphotria hydatis TaxID=2528027 RepID=A0A517T6M0_9PLAN|nr:polysaccharide pyruvyl transferase family protein [Calycomorphotria hydatis]QDT64023.1 Polysaccharide pyruvyl transferase [Calycomorphotria hydatis]
MDRRQFLAASSLAIMASQLRAMSPQPRRILLRSSWQTVNIGDIAHTPGVLHLLEEYLPNAEITLDGNVSNGVKEMLQQRFPNLKFASWARGKKKDFSQYDFLLHGSGPSLVGHRRVKEWKDETNKPYGVFGITVSSVSDNMRELLSGAQFVFFRDSVSLQLCRDSGVTCPVMEFGPDGAFAVDLKNDEGAESFLAENSLEQGKFVCCIPRYRYTPYWLIKKGRELDPVRDRRNQEMKEHDHVYLRNAITEIVKNTDCKVLICPEDQTQMAIGKEMLYDRLPEDVLPRVVWKEDYWLTDEAISIYRRSRGLFGLEMHSPIMCIGNGIPAIVGRFEEQTSKGFMWRDIGLNDWLFDFDDDERMQQYVPTVLEMVSDPAKAQEKAAAARKRVEGYQRRMVAQLEKSLP